MTARKALIALATAGLVVGLTACSGGSTGGASAEPTGTADKPIELTFWGKTQGQKAQVELWNSSHPETQITYVEQGGDADLSQALQNATAAGNAPDLFEVPRTYSVSFLADGVSRDISGYLDNENGAFAEGAFDFVSVGDTVVGVPYATNPTFNAVNTATFGQFGFSAPADWEQFLEQAEAMQQQGGIKSMNLPGEDPSYLRDLATQFGAEWWLPEGDAWRIGFTSPESLAAGDIIQRAVDADIVSNNTYIEWDALMQFFASGKLSQFTTSTWQLPVYEQNFASSVGDWELAEYPKESADAELVSPSYYNVYGVSPSSEYPTAAVAFARWAATDSDAVELLADPVDGSAAFPVTTDPSSVIDQLLPGALLGDSRVDAPEVILSAADSARSMKEGPNQAAATEELVDWWAKVLTKEATMNELLEHMQQWTIADLKSKNIKVVE